jgi:hypothetical protein
LSRRAYLHTSWGFNCTCSHCSLGQPLSRQSDLRVEKIKTLTEKLDDWSSDEDVSTDMAETLVSLYEQERLFVGRAEAYRLAAEIWNSVGQKWTAIKYASLAVEMGIIDDGVHDEDTLSMETLMNNPEAHWSWMKRAKIAQTG